MSRKIYLEVIARFGTDGRITPLSFVFEDGRSFKIERVIEVRRAASLKAGGVGIRYTVRILGAERYIYLDENRWFAESKD